jgi:hypothetical protein
MQTFLPFADFIESAKVLDNKRLGKQRVENLQILKALLDPNYGWQHHPAVKMWKDYAQSLGLYHCFIVAEWTRRGFQDTTLEKFCRLIEPELPLPNYPEHHFMHYGIPSWLGDERVHKTHRSNLLRKDPVYYGQFGWTEPSNLCYYWPVK